MVEDLTAMGRELNQYLELGMRERQTSELVMRRLQSPYIQVKMGKDSMGVIRGNHWPSERLLSVQEPTGMPPLYTRIRCSAWT